MRLRFQIFFFLFVLFHSAIFGQTRIKAMTYNLMHYPGTLYYNSSSQSFIGRTPVLKQLLDAYQPDIFMTCEVEESQAAEFILREALNTSDSRYSMVNFTYNQSSSYTGLQQMLYYNSRKLTLINQDIILTNIRDINHYSFRINTPTPLFLEIFVAHLKASQGSTNENKRLQMVQRFTSYIENLPADSYVLFGGDFNFYKATESGYQELLDPTNNIRLVDPIDRAGYWHNNDDFQDIHTQSPLHSNSHFQSASGGSDGVTGGLDDRFDFILLSQNLQNGTALTYVSGTYKSYGNNGNCFNNNINDTSCAGYYSQTIRDLLFNMSDHIPVVMELETADTISLDEEFSTTQLISIKGSNYTADSIVLSVSYEAVGSTILIYNQLGQVVGEHQLTSQNQSILVANLNKGIYYLSSPQFSLHSPLKFVKI